MSRASRREIIHDLQERLRQITRSGRPVRQAVLPAGCTLGRFLPGQELTAGTLIEWLGEGEGSGAATLALAVAAELCGASGILVLIDTNREFYPPAAAGLGIPLDRTVVVQPASPGDALWALEQALRSAAVTVAFGWIEALSDRVFHRLQLAAQTGGTLGFLLRPAACRTEPSCAQLRLLVEAAPRPESSALWDRIPILSTGAAPTPGLFGGWRLRARVLHRRGGPAGETITLELNHEARLVSLAAPMAHSALAPRASGAS